MKKTCPFCPCSILWGGDSSLLFGTFLPSSVRLAVSVFPHETTDHRHSVRKSHAPQPAQTGGGSSPAAVTALADRQAFLYTQGNFQSSNRGFSARYFRSAGSDTRDKRRAGGMPLSDWGRMSPNWSNIENCTEELSPTQLGKTTCKWLSWSLYALQEQTRIPLSLPCPVG